MSGEAHSSETSAGVEFSGAPVGGVLGIGGLGISYGPVNLCFHGAEIGSCSVTLVELLALKFFHVERCSPWKRLRRLRSTSSSVSGLIQRKLQPFAKTGLSASAPHWLVNVRS